MRRCIRCCIRFLARLATGQIALWRAFWLIGTPLALLWDVTGAYMVFGFGVEEPVLAGSIIVLFTLASLALPFVAFAIWRSATNYPRETWWQSSLAIAAKSCAAFSGLLGVLSVIGLLYLASDLIQAVLA
jgi:hypothetical protein